MIWILSLRYGWCGPYLPIHVRDHLEPLAAVAVAGLDRDRARAVENWAEELEPSVMLIEHDPPSGLTVMADYRFGLKASDGRMLALYGWAERPRSGDGRQLAELVSYWIRGWQGGEHVG